MKREIRMNRRTLRTRRRNQIKHKPIGYVRKKLTEMSPRKMAKRNPKLHNEDGQKARVEHRVGLWQIRTPSNKHPQSQAESWGLLIVMEDKMG